MTASSLASALKDGRTSQNRPPLYPLFWRHAVVSVPICRMAVDKRREQHVDLRRPIADDDRNRRVRDERAVWLGQPGVSQCVGERLTVVVVADEDERRHDGRCVGDLPRCQAAANVVTTPFEGRQLALARWPSQLQPGRPAMLGLRRRWWTKVWMRLAVPTTAEPARTSDRSG
jgi:hypothetical protein